MSSDIRSSLESKAEMCYCYLCMALCMTATSLQISLLTFKWVCYILPYVQRLKAQWEYNKSENSQASNLTGRP